MKFLVRLINVSHLRILNICTASHISSANVHIQQAIDIMHTSSDVETSKHPEICRLQFIQCQLETVLFPKIDGIRTVRYTDSSLRTVRYWTLRYTDTSLHGHFVTGHFVTRTLRYMDSSLHGQFVTWTLRYTDTSLQDTSLHGQFVTWTVRYWILRYTDTSLHGHFVTRTLRYMDSSLHGQFVTWTLRRIVRLRLSIFGSLTTVSVAAS